MQKPKKLKVKHLALLIWLLRLLSIQRPQIENKIFKTKCHRFYQYLIVATRYYSEFNRLAKISFHARMKKVPKDIAVKNKVGTAYEIKNIKPSI